MAEEMVTFELIRKIQREEDRVPKLTKIPENFYDSVKSYLQQKKSMGMKGDDKHYEIKSIERLVESIFNKREGKIINAALNNVRNKMPPENMTKEETDFFDAMVYVIKKRREEEMPKQEKEQDQEVDKLIVFRQEVPQFLGSDMRNYGPFKKGDIARLPDENMKILVEQGFAEEFKVAK